MLKLMNSNCILFSIHILIIQLMKQAQRVYLRHKYNKNEQSPFFKSNVRRGTLDPVQNREPGPGSYEITLPLIKPKYQAIFKNNRSIIIKVNDIPVPPFCSKQARFKQYTTIQPKSVQSALDLVETQKQIRAKVKNSRRYNFTLAKKRSVQSISSTMILTNQHNLNSQTQNHKGRGPQWSKYKQQRTLWNKVCSNFPGPGSYDATQKSPRIFTKNSSWQFRSSTKRNQPISKSSTQKDVEMPEDEQKVNGIHNRQNLLNNQYD